MLNSFLNKVYKIFLTYLVIVAFFIAYRVAFTFRYGGGETLLDYLSDLAHAFAIGIKFDTLIICYFLSIAVILNIIHTFLKNEKLQLFFERASRFWIIFTTILLCVILMIDHQYYTYFQAHLNILVFGFIEDDTLAVLKSMWTDHPVFLIIVLITLQIIIIRKVLIRIWTKCKLPNFISNLGSATKWIVISIFFLLYAFGLRGSLSYVFPLKIEDAVVSENRFINKIPLNGAITLIDAIKDYKESHTKISKADVIKNHGYDSIEKLLSDYFGNPSSEFTGPDYEKYFFKVTKKDSLIEKNPYNVVFILMESFGSYFLNFHSDNLNLLGEFENHFYEDYYFKNFLSSTRGTIFSLENILINRNWPAVSNTSMRFKTFNSSVALPFYNAGYETTFVSGGQIAWRNLHEFLPNQYFMNVYGQSVIMKKNKRAQKNIWGVYDEYLFEDIFNQLSNNNDKPKLICALTTTNHTPYKLPENYQAYPTNVSDSIKNIIIANKSIAEKSFRAYQYTNDCLGKFLTKLKNSSLANNTIVAVTGDHNSYTLFPYDNKGFEEIDKHRVPFYLYIPEALKKEKYKDYLNRYGSHKDIFTTLFNLSLSNQKYFTLGNDLLSESLPDSLFYAINESFYIGNQNLSINTLSKKNNARTFLLEYYFADDSTNNNK